MISVGIFILGFLFSLGTCDDYYVAADGGKTRCTPDNRCALDHGVALMNLNEDTQPTIDFLDGTYEITKKLDLYPALSVTLVNSASGDVVISANSTSLSYLFSLNGQPTISIQNMKFSNIIASEAIFNAKSSVEITSIDLKDISFDGIEVGVGVISVADVTKVGPVTLNEVSFSNMNGKGAVIYNTP